MFLKLSYIFLVLLNFSLLNTIASRTPTMVVERLDIIVGSIMYVGLVLPDAVISPITVVGKSCTPEHANTIVIIIGFVIFSLPLYISSIAFIPKGTDAPPIPRSWVDRDIERYFRAFSFIEFLPQSRFISGFILFEINFDNLVSLTIPSIPSQSEYIASSSNDKFSALFVPSSIVESNLSGLVNIMQIKEQKIMAVQIKFIIKYMSLNAQKSLAENMF